MIEVESAPAAVEAPRYPEGWSTSLRLIWRLSSSLAADREAAIRPDDSAARLLSEAGSFLDLYLFSPMAGISLCLEGARLTCYCCGRVGEGERAGLEGPTW